MCLGTRGPPRVEAGEPQLRTGRSGPDLGPDYPPGRAAGARPMSSCCAGTHLRGAAGCLDFAGVRAMSRVPISERRFVALVLADPRRRSSPWSDATTTPLRVANDPSSHGRLLGERAGFPAISSLPSPSGQGVGAAYGTEGQEGRNLHPGGPHRRGERGGAHRRSTSTTGRGSGASVWCSSTPCCGLGGETTSCIVVMSPAQLSRAALAEPLRSDRRP